MNVSEDARNANTVTPVSATTTAGVALAANANRVNYSIYNAGPATVFLREGSVVTSTLYTTPIPSGFLWKEDFIGARYTGVISVITGSGTASLQVSEGTLI